MNRAVLSIWGITVLICAAIIIFGLWPSITQDLNTINETKNAKAKLDEASRMKETLNNLNKNNELANLVVTAKNYIPEDAQSGELILELTAMAGKTNLSVEQLALEADKPAATSGSNTSAPTASEIGFQLTLSGTFENFSQFLKLTETSSRLITIQSLNMNQAPEKFTAEIVGKSYYKKATVFSGNIADITISTATIQKLQNLKTYANPIDTQNEAGFGRVNPFDNINN